LYSVAALTGASGSVVERCTYDAYGKQKITSGGGAVRSRSSFGIDGGFTGRYLDAETSLYYFRARYYSGSLGRFIARDELGYIDGTNLYAGYFVPFSLDPFGTTTTSNCDSVSLTYEIPEIDIKEKTLFSGPYGISIRGKGSVKYKMKLEGKRCCCAKGKYEYSGSVSFTGESSFSAFGGWYYDWYSRYISGVIRAGVTGAITGSIGGSGTYKYSECTEKGSLEGDIGISNQGKIEGGVEGRISISTWWGEYQAQGSGALGAALTVSGKTKVKCDESTCNTDPFDISVKGSVYARLNIGNWFSLSHEKSISGNPFSEISGAEFASPFPDL
jgi:RHS repeat-associated protein